MKPAFRPSIVLSFDPSNAPQERHIRQTTVEGPHFNFVIFGGSDEQHAAKVSLASAILAIPHGPEFRHLIFQTLTTQPDLQPCHALSLLSPSASPVSA